MYLPKKLFVSIGIELTFVPAVLEQLAENFRDIKDERGKAFPVWSYAEHHYYAAFLERMLKHKDVPVYKCGTDPGCVEVPTKPMFSANEYRKTVRAIRKCAELCMLTPTASYTYGGGAHIHTGMPKDIDKRTYSLMLQVWAADNPWLAWAFSAPDDFRNANPLHKDYMLRGGENNPENKLKEARQELEYVRDSYRDTVREIATLEKRLHMPENWGNIYNHNDISYDILYYIRNKRRYKLEIQAAELLVAKLEIEVAKPQVVNEVSINRICMYDGKGSAVTYRAGIGTNEFRCFLMTDTATGHDKHVAIVNEACRKAYERALTCGDTIPEFGYTKAQLKTMKYSEAKRGFNNMLADLDLPVDKYRRECVNIALKMRLARHKGHAMA